ncbi:hypothetical protein L2E82_23017 [Cichorium intybus]|uniref:Uncharacterized protein n=1 Tax=Cichorium intybus TaxID=13427 RepID=A0ACB9E029_CICIN|nr:hypothetical protein L2E82_23017 [Cichorium intybus]
MKSERILFSKAAPCESLEERVWFTSTLIGTHKERASTKVHGPGINPMGISQERIFRFSKYAKSLDFVNSLKDSNNYVRKVWTSDSQNVPKGLDFVNSPQVSKPVGVSLLSAITHSKLDSGYNLARNTEWIFETCEKSLGNGWGECGSNNLKGV